MRTIVRRRLQRAPSDRGLTLIELLVYMLLMGIVMGLVASVIITALGRQREIVAISDATNTGQAVTSAIDMAVLNAVSLRIAEGGDSQVLVTKTRSTLDDDNLGAEESDVARCVGFFYDSETNKLHMASDPVSDVSSTPRTQNIGGNITAAKSWPVLAEGVRPAPGSAGLAARLFSQGLDSTKVDLNFMIDTHSKAKPITFALTSGMRGSGAIDNVGTC